VLFLDDDRGNDPERFTLKPHIQVETSPGYHHHYWLVRHFPLHHFSSIQQSLARAYQGDNRIQALNQAMQLPGFWRRKRVSLPRLSILRGVFNHDLYSYQALQRLLGAEC
jgi:hypothetical protein